MLYAGLDLGQRQDHSAIAVVERADSYRAYSLAVRHIERVPLGEPYTNIVARVRDVVHASHPFGGCSLAVDGTGVGAPVVEMLRGAGLGCEITSVSITGGDRENYSRGVWTVPKTDLIAGLQLMLERSELKIVCGLRDSKTLVRELIDIKARLHTTGRIRVGADGFGEHDDLVIALALACWRAKRPTIGLVPHRLPGI